MLCLYTLVYPQQATKMQTFFNRMTLGAKPVALDPAWGYASAGLQRNLQIVRKYYSTRPFAVKSNHLIARMLTSLGVSYQNNSERFYDVVDAKANAIAMNYRMTSAVHRGTLFDGVFYGPGCKEIIMGVSEYVSLYHIQKNWRTVSAIRVLAHPKSDLAMLLPTGKETSFETGLAVIAINIPMLALQYKCFMEDQVYQNNPGGPLTTAQFVHMYVLPNMMTSHLDVALFNRAVNLTMGAPMGVPTRKHAFMLPSFDDRVDRVYKDLTQFIETNDRDFNTILRSFPCATEENFATLSKLPAQAPTMQVAWAEALARLKTIDWLTTISPNHGLKENAHEVNQILRQFVRYSSDGAFRQITDPGLYLESIRTVRDIAHRTTPQRLVLEQQAEPTE